MNNVDLHSTLFKLLPNSDTVKIAEFLFTFYFI